MNTISHYKDKYLAPRNVLTFYPRFVFFSYLIAHSFVFQHTLSIHPFNVAFAYSKTIIALHESIGSMFQMKQACKINATSKIKVKYSYRTCSIGCVENALNIHEYYNFSLHVETLRNSDYTIH